MHPARRRVSTGDVQRWLDALSTGEMLNVWRRLGLDDSSPPKTWWNPPDDKFLVANPKPVGPCSRLTVIGSAANTSPTGRPRILIRSDSALGNSDSAVANGRKVLPVTTPGVVSSRLRQTFGESSVAPHQRSPTPAGGAIAEPTGSSLSGRQRRTRGSRDPLPPSLDGWDDDGRAMV